MRWLMSAMLAAGVMGCGTEKLETGYVPRKLGANDATRRSFYAAPFAPEAKIRPEDRAPLLDRDRSRNY
ncbi:MAG TPA: hypothetical protein VF669_18755 [Tepidisphaeraceae bacterium]